ncbi:cell division inhibitor [Haloprofundus marisrubri]|uniref:Cell division inhibitor n=1 Tax=Haloprofundus marisrubri TaxID=1514971 RepID=A0A0W1R400_9EURY|nr:cell division inhibitor [Haloprofundus marisrubri]KTG08094.1 cell division inhibitor [Haloprofundus marisrubri]
MSDTVCAALVGATGGAGTTRTALELAATLANDGRDVAILDAAFATQGLADYADGRLDTDMTTLLVEPETPLDAALVDFPLLDDTAGRVACAPASAPFERLARAKTAEAARRFETRVAEASETFDHVLLDVPPVAANQAIAAADAAQRVVTVTPATDRGVEANRRIRDRLADLGIESHATLATRGRFDAADAFVPATDAPFPASLATSGEFAPTVAHAAETTVTTKLDLEFEEKSVLDSVDGFLPSSLRRLTK